MESTPTPDAQSWQRHRKAVAWLWIGLGGLCLAAVITILVSVGGGGGGGEDWLLFIAALYFLALFEPFYSLGIVLGGFALNDGDALVYALMYISLFAVPLSVVAGYSVLRNWRNSRRILWFASVLGLTVGLLWVVPALIALYTIWVLREPAHTTG